MAKFLTFETTALKLNDSVFPCNSVGFGLQANTVPVFNVDGDLLYYSPTAPIQGQLKTSFYLTGALPDFLKLENQNEKSIDVSFNTFFVPNAYLSDLSFSVDPFQPILVNTSFVFYHGLTALRTDLNDRHTNFSNSLKTLNGLSSYVLTNNRTTYDQNPNDFIVSSFNYSFSVDRQPILRVKQKIPSRVALNQINAQFELKANNLDGLLSVYGNDAILTAVLRDNTNLNTSTNLSLTGIIVDQSYNISESSIGEASVKLTQAINRKRNLITIPFEVEDYSIFIPEDDTDVPNSEPNPPPVCGCQSSDNQPPPPPPQNKYDLTINLYVEYIYTDVLNGQNINPAYSCNTKNGKLYGAQLDFKPVGFNSFEVTFGPYDANNQGLTQQSLALGPPYYYIGNITVLKSVMEDIKAGKYNSFVGSLSAAIYGGSVTNNLAFYVYVDEVGAELYSEGCTRGGRPETTASAFYGLTAGGLRNLISDAYDIWITNQNLKSLNCKLKQPPNSIDEYAIPSS